MVCQGKGTTQMWVRGAALALFLAALATFGRYGAPQAAWAHVLMSAISAVLSIAVIFPSLNISAGSAIKALMPATTLSAVCLVGLMATEGFRAELGATPGLFVGIAGVVATWVLVVGWCLKRGIVTLPRP